MNYFIDTEFHEDGRIIDLISIAIVREDDESLYMVSSEFDESICNDFVKKNVLPKLEGQHRFSRQDIRFCIEEFIGDDESPLFFAYYADYDWVAFCQLWGKMVDLPKHFPMLCYDVRQFADMRGFYNIDMDHFLEPGTEHDALADARATLKMFNRVVSVD